MTTYRVNVNGTSYEVLLRKKCGSSMSFDIDGVRYDVELSYQSARPVTSPVDSSAQPQPTPRISNASSALEIRAPMPGIVSDVKAAPGDVVEPGSTLVVIEAMKMENPIKSVRGGTIEAVHVVKGQEIPNGAALITFRA